MFSEFDEEEIKQAYAQVEQEEQEFEEWRNLNQLDRLRQLKEGDINYDEDEEVFKKMSE